MSVKEQINRTLLDEQLENEFKASKSLKESTISRFEHDKYSIMNDAPPLQIIVFECLAVFLFTFGYLCSVTFVPNDLQAAGMLLVAICICAGLCGANINPVITLSNCLKKESMYKGKMLLLYLPAQFVGAIAALAISDVLGHTKMEELTLQGGVFRILANETMGVFILVLFTLLLSNPNTTFIESELSGYISIAIFYHIARSFAPNAGCLINPAITLTLSAHYAYLDKWESLSNCWVWLIGDVLGCLLAVGFYTAIYEPIIKEIREIKRKSQNFESVTEESEGYG